MSTATARSALRHYGRIGVHSEVEGATPHRLIQMLLTGALARLAVARGALERGQVARKGESIGAAISIVEGLRASLDHERGGEVAANLDRLYEYMAVRLLRANADNDVAAIDEVCALLRTVKDGWDAIGGEVEPASQALAASATR